MAAYNQRDVTVVRHEYRLDSPAHVDEIGKAASAAGQHRSAAGVSADILIRSADDEVVVYWIEEATAAPSAASNRLLRIQAVLSSVDLDADPKVQQLAKAIQVILNA